MKKLFRFFAFTLVFCSLFSCEKESENTTKKENKVLILQIDYLTHVFEGGTELSFADCDTFTISSDYQSPGDFGGIQLYYKELDQLLFDGTIIWMGKGKISYPQTIDSANTFNLRNTSMPFPNNSLLKILAHNGTVANDVEEDEEIPLQTIWNAISNLKLVFQYRLSNPEGNIYVFLYTPSVGCGDPNDWDWFVFMKN